MATGWRAVTAAQVIARRAMPCSFRYSVSARAAAPSGVATSSAAGLFMAIGVIRPPSRWISASSPAMNVIATRGWCVIT